MARGFVSNITTPAFLVGTDGTLVFYNEAAGDLLGVGFEEAGPMPAHEWGSRFEPLGEDGAPLAVEDLPLSIPLGGQRPPPRPVRLRPPPGGEREDRGTAVPPRGP